MKQAEWTEDEIAYLKKYYKNGKSAKEIASEIKKTEKAVINKAHKLRLSRQSEFTDKEKEYIRENYKNYNLAEIAATLGRQKTSVCRMARRMGIPMTGKKKEETKRKRKFETDEELTEWKRAYKEEWIREHGHPKGMLGKHHTEEYCEQIRNRVKEWWENVTPEQLEKRKMNARATKMNNGTLCPHWEGNPYSRTKSGKRADLGNVFFRSAWEANIARVLNYNSILWTYEAKTFYFKCKEQASYTPDFYLPEYNVWIEVKGWLDEKSKIKLKAFREEYPDENMFLLDSGKYREVEAEYKSKIENWE